ncbi:MAG: hypothetical protein ACR2JB_27165 [Bryobacteraceae bacterium]
MRRGAKMCIIALSIAFGVLCGFAKSPPTTTCVTGTMLDSEKKKDVVITVMSRQGKLTGGNNNLCVAFKKVETGDPVDVQSVSMDFALLVGRIQETLVKARLTHVGAGCYDGTVNLGRQYYKPGSYYARLFVT